MTTTERIPLLIDCDTGIDDALALLYAANSPEAEIVAVGCVAGNVELPHIVRNTLAVLELAGRPDIRVAAGAERPLVRPLRTAADTHGPTGLGYAVLPAPRGGVVAEDAAGAIVAAARAQPAEVTLVTLGPLTNVALALQREPDLPRLLRRMVMMVGSYRAPGNTAPTLEWNAGVDPEALAAVLTAWRVARAGNPVVPLPVAFGLDVTERAKMTLAHLERLATRAGGESGNAVVRFVTDALRFYFEFHSRYDGFYGAFIHDALALAAALDPGLARTEALAVEVELEGRWTTGETVTDWRRAWGREPNLEIAVEMDVTAFFERFIERVGDLAARRS
ncbi:MAG TPA: nucleoside hydrolase [Candidatus Deferrimicrobium sp.]|nr:nucleoside hydrolase [Candidatus Deferrimicrobium sp.]